MGCKAFTPHLVGLANELEGQPFHLIASYNQRGDARAALHEVFQNGVPLGTANVSATYQARHPGVRGTGYVPYYMVFDHHGDLAYHHQGGPYHGGDGKAVLDRVRDMLKNVPKVYVGKKPYTAHEKLAQKIAEGKKLGSALKSLAKALEEAPEDPELQRLVAAVERHAQGLVRRFDRDVTTQAKQALKSLTASAKEYQGTPWGQDLVRYADQAGAKETRKAHESAAKLFAKALAGWEQLATVRGNGGGVRNPQDKGFRSANEAMLTRITALLEQVSTEHAQQPAGRHAKELLKVMQ